LSYGNGVTTQLPFQGMGDAEKFYQDSTVAESDHAPRSALEIKDGRRRIVLYHSINRRCSNIKNKNMHLPQQTTLPLLYSSDG